jgi:hypothetical protein
MNVGVNESRQKHCSFRVDDFGGNCVWSPDQLVIDNDGAGLPNIVPVENSDVGNADNGGRRRFHVEYREAF